MKKILLLIFVVAPSIVFTQNIKALDLKNGFKDFKFGQPYIIYSHNLEFEERWLVNFNRKWYIFKGTEPSELFYIPWSKLYLGFTGNTLTAITVQFQTKDINKVNKIYNGLLNEFGQPTEKSETYMFNSYHWYGDKVTLTLTYENNNENGKNISIHISNSNLHYYTLQKNNGKF